ncbi:BMP family ABC transporter substrate-binding protein [Ureibacillus thermophilus]|uniref:BMP family ABC transporter substrate-binding protein n=1 Tax=Ureibacillus thermophilus TaxID=367743 RepID=A0A4P6USL0_9BACL|nr:BMP family ABC transporter substrate-binding protein [Ureibacillus thermophilus]QBK26064.1 BMP family ABC transporter substrate-binding protein [Ureibacillus thermophilus]
MEFRKKWISQFLFATFMLVLLFALTACSQGSDSSEGTKEKEENTAAENSSDDSKEKKMPRVAFVYIGVPSDGGWTKTHDEGRELVDKTFGIKSTTVENVPEGPDAERVLEELAQDHDIIFATSYGYMDYVINVAKKYPNVTFLHATGYKKAENVGTYQVKGWESSYLAGTAAGLLAKNGKIGYVGAFPIPEVIYSINAFTLAAKAVNPDVEVSVVWSNTWFDPTAEKQAAETLLDQGIDVLANYQDSPTGIQAAAERNVWGMGNDADMSAYAPETYITNPIINWGDYYVQTVQSWIDGRWKSESYLGGLKEGMANIAPFGKNVPDKVKQKVEEVRKSIMSGETVIFKGPLYDNTGQLRVAEGESLTDEQILSMDWLVEGVKGSIPKN